MYFLIEIINLAQLLDLCSFTYMVLSIIMIIFITFLRKRWKMFISPILNINIYFEYINHNIIALFDIFLPT